jgi:uncharacterized protein
MNALAHKTGFVALLLFAVLFYSAPANAQHTVSSGKDASISKFPEAQGWVNDFEEVLDSITELTLTNLITNHNLKTTNQISIVTISSITPYQFLEDYTRDLSNAWGVGEKDKNNGVTIIYSKALHEVRIATGLGLQNKLTDALCQKVVDEYMLPSFKIGNPGKGMIDGVTEIIRLLEQK